MVGRRVRRRTRCRPGIDLVRGRIRSRPMGRCGSFTAVGPDLMRHVVGRPVGCLGQVLSATASPRRCTLKELVEPVVPGGLPATTTILSPLV